MDIPVDIMRLLHNNPLGEWQNSGDNGVSVIGITTVDYSTHNYNI